MAGSGDVSSPLVSRKILIKKFMGYLSSDDPWLMRGGEKMTKKFIISLVLVVFLMVPVFAFAQDANLNLGIGYATATKLGSKDVRQSVSEIINVAMSLLGIVAVVIILMGGFKWMTAGGNEDQVGEAKKLIIAGVIGLAIILASYSIALFVVNNLISATTGK